METFLRGDKIQKGSIGYDALSDDAKVLIGTNGDSLFEKGDVENSAVLKGGNQVTSEGGVALGKNNLVGLKGFYYKYITLKAGGNTKIANVYLSKTQVSNPTIDTNSGASFKDVSIKPQDYWTVGDIISIVNDAKYDNIATVKQIKDGLIQIEWLDGKSPFSTVKQVSDLSSEDYSIYCFDKPTQGISDLGKYSFATGTDNKAINTYTEVSGKGNTARGKYAKVWGKNNVGGYNTTTFGTNNVNLADNSLVNGTNNINEGNNSVIHGNANENYGKRAFVVGNKNITNNENEAAFGNYNNSENDTHFSIGIGTTDTRKNAFEVKQNGDIYIEGVEGRIQDKLNKLVNITYLELKLLRDNSKLIPGQQYRITNYLTTTTQSNTQSAGHQFDIIVTADDVNVLNENARAIQHTTDENDYFSNSDLNAWELKYCLDNDTNRFAWTDIETYPEIRLEVDDFLKNKINESFGYISVSQIPDILKFSWWDSPRNGEDNYGDVYSCDNLQLPAEDFLCLVYPHGTDVITNPELCIPNICLNSQPTQITLEYDNDGDGIIDKKYIPTSIELPNGKGVIYYMKDEYNNECPYDFKNIQFARWELSNPVGYRNDYDFDNYEFNWVQETTIFDSLKTGFYGLNGSNKEFYYVYDENYDYSKYKVEYTISESPTYCYTFGKDTDYSISGSNYGNVIKEYKNSNKIQLNNIVFLSNSCYYNSFGNSCYDNSFGNSCYSNSFGNYCYYNSFGNSCYNNSFGNSCYNNSFGNSCNRNSFGSSCSSNSFGKNCSSNSFGKYCYSNSFGNNCSYNSFGNYCNSNSFGKKCYNNSFGNNCNNNSFGESCSSNSFGNNCNSNTFGSSSTSLKSFYRYIIFDNGNSYINLNCTSTTSSSKYFQNVRIGLGVNNTTTKKTISDSNVGQTYQTLYKPTDSKELTA